MTKGLPLEGKENGSGLVSCVTPSLYVVMWKWTGVASSLRTCRLCFFFSPQYCFLYFLLHTRSFHERYNTFRQKMPLRRVLWR